MTLQSKLFHFIMATPRKLILNPLKKHHDYVIMGLLHLVVWVSVNNSPQTALPNARNSLNSGNNTSTSVRQVSVHKCLHLGRHFTNRMLGILRNMSESQTVPFSPNHFVDLTRFRKSLANFNGVMVFLRASHITAELFVRSLLLLVSVGLC